MGGEIAELLAQILMFFQDLKFWKKKKARRKFEKEQGLPKKTMIYPSDRYTLFFLIIGGIGLISLYLYRTTYANQNDTKEKIAAIVQILSEEKRIIGNYPKELKGIIRNNPLRKDIINDVWGHAYHYELRDNGATYILTSKGKDGILNTEDDITHAQSSHQ